MAASCATYHGEPRQSCMAYPPCPTPYSVGAGQHGSVDLHLAWGANAKLNDLNPHALEPSVETLFCLG